MCKEMAAGVSTGAASTDELVTAAASALEKALAEQKGVINAWSEQVCVQGGTAVVPVKRPTRYIAHRSRAAEAADMASRDGFRFRFLLWLLH